MTRKEKALENKKQIIDTALTLFNKYGFDNVSVNQIIEETNSSKGAFYGHFKSKNDIYIEKFNEIHEFYREIVEKLSVIDDPSKKLMKFTRYQMIYHRDHLGVDIINTIYRHELESKESSVLFSKDRPNFKILNNYFSEGQLLGVFTKEYSSEEITFLFRKSIVGIVYEWCASNGKIDLVGDCERAVNLFLRLISRN